MPRPPEASRADTAVAAAEAALARVTVVTVTHDSAAVLPGFFEACPPGLAVLVVDNASRDGSAALAEAAGARVIRAPRNDGFGAGCNLGLAAVAAAVPPGEFVLLANPDLRLSARAVAALVAAADAFPEAAILAPGLTAPDGRRVRSWDADQHRRRRLARRRGAEPWPEGPLSTWYVSGAAMLLRSADGLRFDEGFFLFYEDDDLCGAARARGLGVVLVPAAQLAHAGGRSSPATLRLDWRKAFHMARSRLRYAAKHAGPRAALREAAGRGLHHLGKAAGHGLTLRGRRVVQDLAGFAGTLAWLLRRGR